MKHTRSSPLKAHLVKSVRQARRCYRRRLAACQNKFAQGAVHKLRIETRKTLALLELLTALQCVEIPEKLKRNLKRRLDQFSDLRDVHVQLELLKPLWTKFPEARGLEKLLKRREQKLENRLAAKIGKIKGTQLNRRLKWIEKCVADCALGQLPVTVEVAPALQSAFQHVTEWRRQIRAGDARTIHKTRVAFKRFRYLNELVQPVLPKISREELKRMKDFQTRAGHIQDLEVLLARLAHSVRKRKLSPSALRNLRHELLEQKHQAIKRFLDRIDELSKFDPRAKDSGASQSPA